MQTLLQKISNLEKDKAKAMQLSMKAIAARSNIKQYLDDEKARNIEMQEQVQIMGYKIKEADAERNEYANKHDEMFNSVSALNQRIEELENHKLHLLNKLKGYGDKGGLEYIVKTQNLDQLESKQFENRVQVENYDPQAARDAAEQEAQDALKQQKTGRTSKESLQSKPSARKGAR